VILCANRIENFQELEPVKSTSRMTGNYGDSAFIVVVVDLIERTITEITRAGRNPALLVPVPILKLQPARRLKTQKPAPRVTSARSEIHSYS